MLWPRLWNKIERETYSNIYDRTFNEKILQLKIFSYSYGCLPGSVIHFLEIYHTSYQTRGNIRTKVAMNNIIKTFGGGWENLHEAIIV